MSFDLYDSRGNPVAYCDDGENIFTFAGQAVAYLHKGSLYSFPGAHLGRFSHGLVRDNEGAVVFFSEGSSGGPLKPPRKPRPPKGPRQGKPLKGFRGHKPPDPADASSWSALSGEQFFLPP